jgi:hypothetical protein
LKIQIDYKNWFSKEKLLRLLVHIWAKDIGQTSCHGMAIKQKKVERGGRLLSKQEKLFTWPFT